MTSEVDWGQVLTRGRLKINLVLAIVTRSVSEAREIRLYSTRVLPELRGVVVHIGWTPTSAACSGLLRPVDYPH